VQHPRFERFVHVDVTDDCCQVRAELVVGHFDGFARGTCDTQEVVVGVKRGRGRKNRNMGAYCGVAAYHDQELSTESYT
jgi:hypothetical protein